MSEKASNLNDAWSNFDPFLPLRSDSPFYVSRTDSPLGQLQRALLRQHAIPPKYFFSGFGGCGKSTEINRLAADEELQNQYFVVKFSIKDTCGDPNNLSYVEVLTSIAARIFEEAHQNKIKLDKRIYTEIETWGKRVEEHIEEKGIEAVGEAGAGAGIDWLPLFFAKLTGRIQSEYKSRTIIREVIEPTIADLLEKMNILSFGIKQKTKKTVLVLVDDLDKVRDPKLAQEIFKDNLSALLRPTFAIVYTVPLWLFFSPDFPDIKAPNAFPLPNVKLHPKGDGEGEDEKGLAIMREFFLNRMEEKLVNQDALKYASKISGGVFREASRIMRIAADHAIDEKQDQITEPNVTKAVNELRNEFRRNKTNLSATELEQLRKISQTNDYIGVENIARLLEGLFVLEYVNGENWLDVHPILIDILEE